MRNRIAVSVAALLLLSACTPRTEVSDQATPAASPTERGTVSETPAATPEAMATKEPGVAASPVVADRPLVAYENRAKGYTLQRPDRWYWEHLIKSQLPEGDVTDLFRTDPKPLPGIPSETYGMIAIEVSAKNVADVPAYLKNSPSPLTSIAGISATRHEGTVFDGIRVIEYRFVQKGETYRFSYAGAASDPAGAAIFERVVESFKFTAE